MNTIDAEKLALYYCIANASDVSYDNASIPSMIVNELMPHKFGEIHHIDIYSVIKKLVDKQISPTIPNILTNLGEKTEKVGGETYLQSILNFGQIFKIQDTKVGFEDLVRFLDNIGNLRELIELNRNYNKKWGSPEKLYNQLSTKGLSSIDYINTIIDDIEKITSSRGNSGYKSISTVFSKLDEELALAQEGKTAKYIDWGWPSAVEYMFPKRGSMTIIQGDTNSGKSTLAYIIALCTAIKVFNNNEEGYVAINSLEDANTEVLARLVCCYGGLVKDKMDKGVLTEYEMAIYQKTKRELLRLPLVFDDEIITTQQLKMNAKVHSAKNGQRWLGVNDYSELFKDELKLNEERRIFNIGFAIHNIAKTENSAEILVSQITTYQDNEYMIPGLRSTRQSKSLADNARQLVSLFNYNMIHKDLKKKPPSTMGFDEKYAYCIVSKNKGKMGKFPIRCYPSKMRFEDVKLDDGVLFQE
jgi:replicative DNA helicase